MSRVPKAWQGLHPYRYRDNPLEARFARAWADLNKSDDPGQSTLAYLLCEGDQHHPLVPTDEQRKVASTVIQWLGSPVGSRWVMSVMAGNTDGDLGTLGANIKKANRVVGDGPVFSAAEIEFIEQEAGMSLDAKDERILRRILRKMRGK